MLNFEKEIKPSVNQRVLGSSPRGGAKQKPDMKVSGFVVLRNSKIYSFINLIALLSDTFK